MMRQEFLKKQGEDEQLKTQQILVIAGLCHGLIEQRKGVGRRKE
jgi:hypothetical protein